MSRLRFGRCPSILSIVFGLLPLGVPHAATWHVTYDPAQPEDRVGAVAAQAASGDSILIDPGTYYEHIPLEGKSLTFVGVGGADATVLDGSRSLPGREGSIIYTLTGAPADLALDGLTLRNGTGTPYGYNHQIGGGAVLWWKASHTASLAVADCVFEDNNNGDSWWIFGGGAILAGELDNVWIERCSFSGNASLQDGGDLYLGVRTATVAKCDFEVQGGDGIGGASIHDEGGLTMTISECTFQGESEYGYQSGIVSGSRTVEILNNRFIDHGRPLATQIDLTCHDCVGAPRQDVLLSGNLFWNATGPDSAAEAQLRIAMLGGTFVIRENTFVRCGVNVQNSTEGSPIVFENNIIARGTASFFIPPGGDLLCNDFWLTPMTDVIGNLTLSNNITVDPFFCDETNGDFTLSEGSPCALPSSANGACGLMGALPVACNLGIHACCLGQECQLATEEECSSLGGQWMIDPPYTSCDPDPCLTPSVKTTWGGIKAMFREP